MMIVMREDEMKVADTEGLAVQSDDTAIAMLVAIGMATDDVTVP
jgi:hypothetical protein